MKTLLLCIVSALAVASSWADPVHPVAATGSNAIARLKADGQFDSLQAAISAARYGAKADAASGDVFAANPSHGFSSRFSPAGLRLTARTGDGTNAVRYTSEWRLEAVGYGDALTAVPRGEVVAAGQRVELRRKVPAVVEWFENRPNGLEHGFTLAERPAGNSDGQPLRVRLAVEGDLQPVVEAGGQKLALRNAAGATVMTYDKLKVWDATGRQVAAVMEAQPGQVLLTVLDAEATYPLTIDPTFLQEAYVKANNTGMGHVFGKAVAASGNTVVVGAPFEDSIGTGAAYIYTRIGTNWTQQAYLRPSSPVNDLFGWSVAVSGDTVVVGDYGEASNATGVNGTGTDYSARSGAAYIYTRNGTMWTQQAYLKASNAGSNDYFGVSVAVSGDTAVVGAPREDSNATGVNGNQGNNSATNSGAAYIFTRSGTNWTQQAYLKASNTGADDEFGTSVAVSGDTVIIGADLEDSNMIGVNGNQADNSAIDAGAAYIFVRSGTTWTQQAYLKASNTGADDSFGWSVAVSGDTAVVGAYAEDSNATGVNGNQLNNSASLAGAAYVFVRNGTTWMQQAYLKASNAGANDNFGWSVAVSGDTAVVGADGDDSSATGVNGNQTDIQATSSGAAYVFVRSGTTWTQQAYLKASNTGVNDFFGGSVAVSGDTVIVGADYEDSSATGVNGNQTNNTRTDSGAAYIFISTYPEIAVEQPVGANLTNGVSAVAYPGQFSGSVGSPLTFTLRSLGPAPLTGIRASLVGANPGDFILNTNLVPTSLGASLSTNISVSFAPSANGYRSAILRIASDDQDENPFDIALVGVGLQSYPEIAVEQPAGANLTNGVSAVVYPGQLSGSVGSPLTFTLRSLGPAPLTGISASLLGANPGDFILNTNLIPTSLGSSQSTNISVSFAPSASGYRSAILRIVSNDEDEGIFDIALVGIGLGTSSFTNSTALTIPSLGNASVYPSTITLSNVTGSVTDIRVRFTGFAHLGPDDVDALLVGPSGQVVALMSDSGGGWTVTNINLTFTDRATTLLPDSTIISDGTNRPTNFPGTEVLPPSATGTIGTNLMDLATNGVNGDWKLYIKDDSSTFGGGSLNAWSLTFELLPSEEIDVSLASGTNLIDGVSSVNFGSPPPGTNSVTTSFTLRNLGGTNLTGIQVTKGGVNSGEFALGTNGLPSSLAPGASAVFTVTFTPAGSGSRSASLQILSSDADEESFDVALVGSGTSALQSWRQLNFGTTSNTGLAADTADADLDGVTNVVEFAFGLNPNSSASKLLPQGVVSNGNFVLSFTQPAGVSGVAYGVDWSPNPAPGPWNPVTDTGVFPAHLFSVPTNGNPTIFMRLKISVTDP